MAEKIEDTIKQLVSEGRKRGVLTYSEINRILEDQFLPPDRMDAVFVTLEDNGIEVQDDADTAALREEKDDHEGKLAARPDDGDHEDEMPEPLFQRSGMPEKIDDPVRMYLTQMGEIPLLTRDQEIYLAKTIEITRKRFRKKAIGSGLAMTPRCTRSRRSSAASWPSTARSRSTPTPSPTTTPRSSRRWARTSWPSACRSTWPRSGAWWRRSARSTSRSSTRA
jgi:hypothetical protein